MQYPAKTAGLLCRCNDAPGTAAFHLGTSVRHQIVEKTLVLVSKASRGVEQPDDKSRMIHCRHCGHVTEWTGEIKWPKAA